MRQMIRGGYRRKEAKVAGHREQSTEDEVFNLLFSNRDVENIVGATPLIDFIHVQYLKYIAHICREPNNSLTKRMLFAQARKPYYRDPWIKLSNLLQCDPRQAKKLTQSRKPFNSRIQHIFGC